MLDEFAKATFESAGADRDALRLRLSQVIAQRLHEAASREFEAIRCELRALGHHTELRETYDPEFAAWHSSATPPEQGDEALGLRFYYDSQVSSFYDGTENPNP
jgi:hypothetical protein